MDAREHILKRLQQATTRKALYVTRPEPVPVVAAPATVREQQDLFCERARGQGATVYVADNVVDARLHLVSWLQEQGVDHVWRWDLAEVGVPGLDDVLRTVGVSWVVPDPARVASRDASVRQAARVGITGADAGIATTGTVVLSSGPGRPRTVSLLPETHVAVVLASRLFPTVEACLSAWEALYHTQPANIVFVSGPSRTADIEMTLVMGVHGPRHVHVVLVVG